MSAPAETTQDEPRPPHEALGRLFLRFLRFGALAWGGPVAQIAMIRDELVDRERWISPVRFNRVLAVYQVLPGPEAHELCVYFGMRARGRLGALLAGLGFMLPMQSGEARELDARVAARALVGMVLIFVLTQEVLGGRALTPIADAAITGTISSLFLHGILRPETPPPCPS